MNKSTHIPRPHYLLADSRLLFRTASERSPLHAMRSWLGSDSPVAYIGASHGDSAEPLAIFASAMDSVGLRNWRTIGSKFPNEDRDVLLRSDLIVLAGGDVERGWRQLQAAGMHQDIIQRHADGATLIGISAGAIHLGRYAIIERVESCCELKDTMGLVPFLIDVHDEAREWRRLAGAVEMLQGKVSGVGIPRGGGMLFHSDGSLEVIRGPVSEFSFDGKYLQRSLLV